MNDVIDSSAKEYLNQFMARIERLEEDKRVVLEDIKELISKIKDLKADDQDRALKFLNKAFAAKQRGDKDC